MGDGEVTMINRLIDMNVNIQKPTTNISTNVGNYTIEQYAIAFISGLEKNQKERFKQMLENNIKSGMSVAKSYGIDYDEFITEVKKLLQVNV